MTAKVQTPVMNGKPVQESSSQDDVKEQLYKTFNDALEATKKELAQVQEKLQEYDEKFQASSTVKQQRQKASDYLHTTLEEIKKSLDGLSQKAHHTFVEASDFTKETIEELWSKLKESIEKLKNLTLEFDDKYHVTEKLTDLTAPLLTQLKSFGKSLDQAGEAIKDATLSGRSYLIGAAASLEHKFQIESKLNGFDQKYKIVETAKSLQNKGEEFLAKQHILERVKQFDERITGSRAGELIEQGVKLVSEEIEKVQKDYETAKSK